MKRILFFGIFDLGYSRTKVLAEGFRQNGYEVIFCRVDPRSFGAWQKYRMLYAQGREFRYQKFDHVLVCFPSRVLALVLARLLFGQLIIFDAFLSAYDSNVFDRNVYSVWSLRAVRDYASDWVSCRLAWKILLDTNEHINYFVSTFGVRKGKCIRVFVGADEKIFSPRKVIPTGKFSVHFHGIYTPLQGVSYIIEAANLLKNQPIRFKIIGWGTETDQVRERAQRLGLSNIEFINSVPLEELPSHIASADVCLGIFGYTPKTARVIPNKVYECMNMGKPIITADTPAIRELPGGRPPLFLVQRANPTALAKAIVALMNDPVRCARLGGDAASYFKTHLTARTIVADLLTHL